jgi:signal transduction histidine kinase
MSTPNTNLYKRLSAIRFLRKSYALKFLFIAFLGIHIPLIGIVVYVGFWAPAAISPLTLLLLTLIFTLAATAATLVVLNKLLNPVRLAEQSLQVYLTNKKIPELQDDFKDEIGSLLHSIRYTIMSLEEANKTKLEMMYTITHDLRSPLAQIIMLAELQKAGGLEADNFGDIVKTCAQNELDFIDNYIGILSSDSDKELVKTDTKVRIEQLIAKTADLLQIQLKNKKLQLNIQIGEAEYIYTTKDLLFEHVIRNLMSNAVKFSKPGGVIEIKTECTDTQTILSVKDCGIGFLPHLGEQLFTKFTPHKRMGTAGESTKGIGLYLTREIVKQHNGTITATSEGENKGAVFTVVLNSR